MQQYQKQNAMGGEQIYQILTKLDDYLSLYQQWGCEGIPRKEIDTHQSEAPLTLDAVQEQLSGCQRCKLHKGRTHIVFGEGNPQALLLFVGEGPGFYEDQQGRPFVGKAGELLTKMIQAIGLQREDVYITNIVKCRPPKNRDPEPDEIASCEPFLRRQIECIQPGLICALGRVAAQTLLQTTSSLSGLRGRFHQYHGITLLPTFHPAYLLRYPQDKRLAWKDLQMVQREYQHVCKSLETEENT